MTHCVDGSGPGGYTASIRAAQFGVRVACIERASELGGTCLRIGCISTKAWVQTAFALNRRRTFEKLGVRLDGLHLEFAKVNAWKAAVVKKMTQGVSFLFKSNSVEWIKGTFKDANTIGVEGSEDVSFKSAIVAMGSLPAAHADPSGSSRIAASTPRDCSRRLRFPSVSSSSAVGSSGASSRRSKIQALQCASFLAAFSASASGRCKLVNQEIRIEYYLRFTDAMIRVSIKRTTFRFRKKLRVVRLT